MINFRRIHMLITDFRTCARKLGFSQPTVLKTLNACLDGKRILGMGILRPHILGMERSHPWRLRPQPQGDCPDCVPGLSETASQRLGGRRRRSPESDRDVSV